MQSHELLRDVIHQAGAKQVAAQMGLSLSLVYKWTEPDDPGGGSGAVNPLDRMRALWQGTRDPRLIQWLCEEAGGFLVLNPKPANNAPERLVPATQEIVKEFADLLQVIASSAADNQVSKEEARTIRARWEDLKTVTEGFVRCCEQGNFAPARPPAVAGPRARENRIS